MYKNYVILALVAILAVGGFVYFTSLSATPPLGAAAGPDFFNQVAFYSGVVNRNQIATTSQGSVTVKAVEFTGWANSSLVSFSQGLVATPTVTFPASSTIANVVPKAGDTQTFCIRNATTTANVAILLAGGTGTNLLVASSSVSALGGKLIPTGKVGCITLVREPVTSTTFDIDALLTVYQ